MKLFRYRKPSMKTVLGVTKAKKQIKKDLGITAAMKPFRFWGNTKRKVKRDLGYYSPVGKVLRNGLPRPGGCLLTILAVLLLIAVAAAAIAVILI
jgi:hypothetical protein